MNSRGLIQSSTLAFLLISPLALSLVGLKGRRCLQGWLQSPVPGRAGPARQAFRPWHLQDTGIMRDCQDTVCFNEL